MRFTKFAPQSLSDLRTAVLEDTGDLCPGLRTVAAGLPIPGHETIDLLATDPRGRLVMILVRMQADEESVGCALAQWNWLVANLGVLRALAPVPGLDPLADPRLFLVAASATDSARRLAGFSARPEVELFQATLLAAGDRRGVMLDRIGLISPPEAAPGGGTDPILAHLPAGESRSLMRRVIEELRDATIDGDCMRPMASAGAVDLLIGDRVVASLSCSPQGLRLRLFDKMRTMEISDDQGCRAGVVEAMSAAREPEPAAPAAITAALSPEEIAEFERIAGPVEGRGARHHERDVRDTRGPAVPREAPAVTVMRHRFVEN